MVDEQRSKWQSLSCQTWKQIHLLITVRQNRIVFDVQKVPNVFYQYKVCIICIVTVLESIKYDHIEVDSYNLVYYVFAKNTKNKPKHHNYVKNFHLCIYLHFQQYIFSKKYNYSKKNQFAILITNNAVTFFYFFTCTFSWTCTLVQKPL